MAEPSEVRNNKTYRIRIDKENLEVDRPTLTGRELLALVGKTPEQYNLYEHKKGQTTAVKADQVVDLTAPGLERFTTLKVENTEG